MKTHELKCWPDPYQAIVQGFKRLEIRKNDRHFDNGDVLILLEFHPCERCSGSGRMWDVGDKMECVYCTKDHGHYTREYCKVRVTHILPGGFGLQEGFVAMSIALLAVGTGDWRVHEETAYEVDIELRTGITNDLVVTRTVSVRSLNPDGAQKVALAQAEGWMENDPRIQPMLAVLDTRCLASPNG